MLIVRSSFLILIFLLVLWAAGYIAFLTQAASLVPNQKAKHADAIIVLTGGNNRIQTGLNLFAAGLAPNLFITGVHKDVSEKEILSQWPEETPLPACCIILGHKATTTRENAAESLDWIKKNNIQNIHLVTSSYHMRRALLEFHQTIPYINIIPHPVQEKNYALSNYKFWTLTFSEYNKVIFRAVSIAIERIY